MRASARAHYSLRMMTEFARAYGSGPLSLAEVARTEHLPLAYLEQLAGQLRRSDLLVSTRGVHGGYALARDPSTIRALDVLVVVEGEVAPVDCSTTDYTGDCVMDGGCASRPLWSRLKTAIDDVLSGTTLADLVAESEPIPAPQPSHLTPLPMAGTPYSTAQGASNG